MNFKGAIMQITSDTSNTTTIFSSNSSEETVNNENSAFDLLLSTTEQKEDELFTPPEKERTRAEIIEDMEQLVADIRSVATTGMTEAELEALDKMLAEIQKEMKKDNPDEKKLKEMMDNLDEMIAKIKKAMTGEAIIDAEDAKENGKEDGNTVDTSKTSLSIQARVENAEKEVIELKNEFAKESMPKKSTYHSTELLQEIKKFQG